MTHSLSPSSLQTSSTLVDLGAWIALVAVGCGQRLSCGAWKQKGRGEEFELPNSKGDSMITLQAEHLQ